MSAAIFCFSDRGARLAMELCKFFDLPLSNIHSTDKFARKYAFTAHKSVCADMGRLFSAHRLLIFICACGIAVRDIAPHLKSKTEDPAVLVMDDNGRFVIPILSGHIGGANEYARKIAAITGAVPVITTATDGAERFSCDAWAASHNCAISSMSAARDVSAAILTGDVALSSEYPLPEKLPPGLIKADSGETGIWIGIHKMEPYAVTLRLIPRVLRLGIGCRRGVSADTISAAVRQVLDGAGIDLRAVSRIATIDVKRHEAGLLDFAGNSGVPIVFYSAAELSAVKGDFEESDFVRQTVGAGSVCERAAALDGTLIIRKTAMNGVTVAAATGDWRPVF